jgi:hypothetical protein
MDTCEWCEKELKKGGVHPIKRLQVIRKIKKKKSHLEDVIQKRHSATNTIQNLNVHRNVVLDACSKSYTAEGSYTFSRIVHWETVLLGKK